MAMIIALATATVHDEEDSDSKDDDYGNIRPNT